MRPSRCVVRYSISAGVNAPTRLLPGCDTIHRSPAPGASVRSSCSVAFPPYPPRSRDYIAEHMPLTIFRSVAAARIEPVLSDLMPYYERDEARHVGLGVMYLPTLLRDAGPIEVTRLRLLQLKIVTLIGWGTHIKRPYFEA